MVKHPKKLCRLGCGTPAQLGKKHDGCCGKCSPAPKKLCRLGCGTPALNPTKHDGCCWKHSPATKILCRLGCGTPARNPTKHDGCCIKCSPHAPTIELLPDTVESVDELVRLANQLLLLGYLIYAGLLGTSGQSEIDQDVNRLIKAGLITTKVEQHVAYVDADEMHNSAHATARDVERLLINKIGLARLLNSRKGGAGRIPKDTSIGAVFIMVCKK